MPFPTINLIWLISFSNVHSASLVPRGQGLSQRWNFSITAFVCKKDLPCLILTLKKSYSEHSFLVILLYFFCDKLWGQISNCFCLFQRTVLCMIYVIGFLGYSNIFQILHLHSTRPSFFFS